MAVAVVAVLIALLAPLVVAVLVPPLLCRLQLHVVADCIEHCFALLAQQLLVGGLPIGGLRCVGVCKLQTVFITDAAAAALSLLLAVVVVA